MYERQYTRVDTIAKYVDQMLKECAESGDWEGSRCGYVHLYGVGQAAGLIALKRGHDRQYAELAVIAGMLHDYETYHSKERTNHAHKSSITARAILENAGNFTENEIQMICQAIYCHSDKELIGTEFDEILKDADEMQHWLRNPAEAYGFEKERTQKIIQEFGLISTSIERSGL